MAAPPATFPAPEPPASQKCDGDARGAGVGVCSKTYHGRAQTMPEVGAAGARQSKEMEMGCPADC